MKIIAKFAALWFAAALLLAAPAAAQSTDPDKPTTLTKGAISGSSAGAMSDEKTFYYSFDVKPGTLTLTLDVIPVNKSDGGGLVQWTLMNTKFAQLKYDNLAAQNSPERQVKDLPVTVKRRIILKIVAAGNINYKFLLAGSAVSFAQN